MWFCLVRIHRSFLNLFGPFPPLYMPAIVRMAEAPPVAQMIRVAVANQPRLMRELIALSLAEEEGVEVVADITDEAQISQVIEETTPDFLIVALDSRRFGASAREEILQKHPEMKIMALASDGNSFTLFSASDGIRSMVYKSPEAEILNVMRDQSHMERGG
jgi:DNA-binding NarL/FixJ family response regulator